MREYTVPELAEALRISTRFAWKLVHDGTIPHVRHGKCVRVMEDDLRNYQRACRAA